MEELQDAIEDAQYVNAIATQEEGPRPVLSWEIPTEEQLTEWEAKLKLKSRRPQPKPLGLDWTLSSAIGFFLFSAFLKEECEDYLRINFVEDVIRWRRSRGKHRVERAREMAEVYLKELPKDEATGETVLPPKTEIDEYDLTRKFPSFSQKGEEFEKMCEMNLDASKSKNVLGLDGPLVEQIISAIENLDTVAVFAHRRVSPPVPESGNGRHDFDNSLLEFKGKYTSLKEITRSLRGEEVDNLPDSLFDKAEAVVMNCLRKEYWGQFLESVQFRKTQNFLWFQDRPVVPDDFFTMRVLGRGGFGLVTGKNCESWS
jgi:hypothetical protein